MDKIHGCQNSQVPLAGSIYGVLIRDIAAGRPPVLQSSLNRDLSTIRHRLSEEGLQFCTIALPTLAKAVIQSFRTGGFASPPGFKQERGTALPRLFSGLLKEIYAKDGALLPDASCASITEVLQLSGLGYKLGVPCGRERDQKVIDDFLKTEEDLKSLIINPQDPVLQLARTVVADVFPERETVGFVADSFNPREITPRHGPGSVATGERPGSMDKWRFKRKYLKLHQAFPYYEYFLVHDKQRRALFDRRSWYRSLRVEERGVAKVTLVPKDSRGPRLISAEPLEYQYIQQGLDRALRARLESHPFTRRRVNFADQTINRDLAMIGSWNGLWATLDMKEASDRVSCSLVHELFASTPKLREYLFAARSDATKLPDNRVIDLHKFAPMGSAICFSIESIVHYALAVAAIMHVHGLQWWEAAEAVYVYGDDLIIDTRYTDSVLDTFPRFGLMFNRDKCFVHGPFRESCGFDAFKGTNIAPVRWRKPWPQHLDAVTFLAYCELASLFYQRGYLHTAEWLWRKLEKESGKLPTSPLAAPSGYLGRKSRFNQWHTPHPVRWEREYHRVEHYSWKLTFVRKKATMCGWDQLLKKLTTGDGTSSELSPYSRFEKEWMSLQPVGIQFKDFHG